jgi:hypothetical protein
LYVEQAQHEAAIAQLQQQLSVEVVQRDTASSELSALSLLCAELEKTRQSENDAVKQQRAQQARAAKSLSQAKNKMMGSCVTVFLPFISTFMSWKESQFNAFANTGFCMLHFRIVSASFASMS